MEQLTSGLYGGIIVLEPGHRYDPSRDHLFVVGWDGGFAGPPHVVVNGDSTPAPLELKADVHHRMRFVFIGPANGETFSLRGTDGAVTTWRQVARDGFEMPAAQQHASPASITGWAGQTHDFDFRPAAPGEYLLFTGDPKKPEWQQRVIVR